MKILAARGIEIGAKLPCVPARMLEGVEPEGARFHWRVCGCELLVGKAVAKTEEHGFQTKRPRRSGGRCLEIKNAKFRIACGAAADYQLHDVALIVEPEAQRREVVRA